MSALGARGFSGAVSNLIRFRQNQLSCFMSYPRLSHSANAISTLVQSLFHVHFTRASRSSHAFIYNAHFTSFLSVLFDARFSFFLRSLPVILYLKHRFTLLEARFGPPCFTFGLLVKHLTCVGLAPRSLPSYTKLSLLHSLHAPRFTLDHRL